MADSTYDICSYRITDDEIRLHPSQRVDDFREQSSLSYSYHRLILTLHGGHTGAEE